MLDGGCDGLVTTVDAFVSGFLFAVTRGFFTVESAFRVGSGCRGVSGSGRRFFGASFGTVDGCDVSDELAAISVAGLLEFACF